MQRESGLSGRGGATVARVVPLTEDGVFVFVCLCRRMCLCLRRPPGAPVLSPDHAMSSSANGCAVSPCVAVPNSGVGGDRKVPFLIGVAGGTASGKSTVCRKIMEKLGQDVVDHSRGQRVVCISQESFYRELSEEEREEALKGNYNFDHPDALDADLIVSILRDVLRGKEVQLPVYDFALMRKTNECKLVHPADVVLLEGILAFYYPELRDLFQMRLFVDTDPDTRLARRVLRDVQERGRDLEFVLTQYMTFVKPAFEEFCLPTKKYADVIIPRGADNQVAIDLIVQNIGDYLSNKEHVVPRPTTPGSGPPTTRPRMFSGSGSFSTMYGSSPPPARPH